MTSKCVRFGLKSFGFELKYLYGYFRVNLIYTANARPYRRFLKQYLFEKLKSFTHQKHAWVAHWALSESSWNYQAAEISLQQFGYHQGKWITLQWSKSLLSSHSQSEQKNWWSWTRPRIQISRSPNLKRKTNRLRNLVPVSFSFCQGKFQNIS